MRISVLYIIPLLLVVALWVTREEQEPAMSPTLAAVTSQKLLLDGDTQRVTNPETGASALVKWQSKTKNNTVTETGQVIAASPKNQGLVVTGIFLNSTLVTLRFCPTRKVTNQKACAVNHMRGKKFDAATQIIAAELIAIWNIYRAANKERSIRSLPRLKVNPIGKHVTPFGTTYAT